MNEGAKRIKREIFGKPKEVKQEQPDTSNEINPGLLKMFPPKRLAGIMAKELRKYKAAQEKKWVRWFKAVSR